MDKVHPGKSGRTPRLARFFAIALCIVVSVVHTSPALAHRAHAGLTEIAWNSSSHEIEITHRLYAHDLEPRLFHSIQGVWEETPEGIAKIGKYIRAHFSIKSDNTDMPLSYVGAEADGEFIFVYFTANLPETLSELKVRNAILFNDLDDQVNLVNLTLNGKTQSQYFRFGDKAKSFVWAD